MDFSFNARTFRDLFNNAVAEYFDRQDDSVVRPGQQHANSPHDLLKAMEQAIDVMADIDSGNDVQHDKPGVLQQDDISKIGQYTLDILEAVIALIQDKTGEQDRDLLRLSVPVSLWVARHGGKLSHIDMVVNSLAGYANEIVDPHKLSELSVIIREIIDACDDEIHRDLDQSNIMRPWRILNMNYGIVATRSHDPEIIDQAYQTLVKNLPQDAREFFREGMRQMDIIGYPDEVREIVERYNKMWGSGSALH